MPAMTKLDAVNACLAAINEYRVGALETGTTSIAAEAERYVDSSARYFCAMGWPCNTRRSAGFTPDASQVVDLAGRNPPVLRIRAAGPNQHRNLVMRGTKVFDSDTGSFALGTTSTIFLDVAELLEFVDLDPALQEQVAQHAAQMFARRQNGNPAVDQYLSQELGMTDQIQLRQETFPNVPMFAPPQQQQRG